MMRWLRWALLIVLVVAAATGTGAWVQYNRVFEPYRGYSRAFQFVEIPSGVGPTVIGERLVDAGVVRDGWT